MDASGIDLTKYGRVTGPETFYATYYQSDYYYTGSPQTFTAPVDGWYTLQTYGGIGGSDMGSANPQYGGYSTGRIHLKAEEVLYVIVGGNGVNGGTVALRAYNGGGINSLNGYGAGGGGATHIARSSTNQLWQYGNARNASMYVLLVAGGSGGLSDYAPAGGGGGGLVGNKGGGIDGGFAGSQNSGYAFGRGEDANGQSAGGGGGWYGGFKSGGIPNGAGGGSGWFSTTLNNASTQTNVISPVGSRGGFARILIYSID